MKLMQKGNRQIKVSESRCQEYTNKGYQEIDENGNYLKATKSTDKLKEK